MAIFWALLLLLTNILPGSPVDAHHCRQLQVTQWFRFPYTDAQACLSRNATWDHDLRNLNNDLFNISYIKYERGEDKCLNLWCAKCKPTFLNFDKTPNAKNDEVPLFDKKHNKCWVPIAGLQFWRVYKSSSIRRGENKCGFKDVMAQFQAKHGYVWMDALKKNPGQFANISRVITIRLNRDRDSAPGIEDDVKCS
ncbi:hypothetical protein BCR37DRAFT_387652 [Protomyces lactucae-debilis]|uniref:Uncharacterized protein n=1 Tax=Protomyces lactucae-debilis TaxID=2754530 RepID=A0A1Y2FBR5_PROLT|nr:uncharacterized protein BCR37DRAFT_387652 [Protomyces lactucae-debilis]ORY81358.1 hypothetical protein BCR37DRAFT_387652 [Protomyces lactucae-debilis]